MTQLTESELVRLVKLLGLLSSDQAGERATAGAMAWRFLRERKLSWADVLRPRSAEPPPLAAPGSGWRRIARECLAVDAEVDALSDWERRFCQVIAERCWPPSDKQLRVLARLAAGLGVDRQ